MSFFTIDNTDSSNHILNDISMAFINKPITIIDDLSPYHNNNYKKDKLIKKTWDEYFINLCEGIKLKSKDPKRKVGVCIVDDENNIVSTGFNGPPRGYDDDNIDWDNRDYVMSIIIHAENKCYNIC